MDRETKAANMLRAMAHQIDREFGAHYGALDWPDWTLRLEAMACSLEDLAAEIKPAA